MNERGMMKKCGRLIGLIALCGLTGCGEDVDTQTPVRQSKVLMRTNLAPDDGEDADESVCELVGACRQEEIAPCDQASMSAREIVERRLAAENLRLGYNGETQTAIFVGEGRLRVNETSNVLCLVDGEVKYDFPCDKDDDDCIRRSKTHWCAYADCLAEISSSISENVRTSDSVVETDSSMYFECLDVLLSAESGDGDSYSVAVAVKWQPKQNRAATVSIGRKPMGLTERIEELNEGFAFGVRQFRDKDGVRWGLGIACTEEPDSEHAGVMPFRLAKAKRLAYEFALRSDKVQVSVRQKCHTKEDGHGNDGGFEGTVTVSPVMNVASNDAENVKWFVLSGVDPLTKRKVRRCFCAIREPLLDSVDKHDNQAQ